MALTASNGTFQGFGARVSIHNDHIGFVCGKRFATLSDIGRATHTRIVVANDTEAPFKMVTIGGRSVQDVTAAYNRLMQVAREAEARTPRVADMPSSMTALNIMPLQGIEHRVEIQKEDVGMVLGAKGSTLRKLGNDTWTWVKFFKGTDAMAPTFSIRGFLQEDVGKAVTRMLSIAQESFNRRTGGPRHQHNRAHEPMAMVEKATFRMAPVPKERKVRFKPAPSSAPTSPTYTPTSPTYTPRTPPSA
jgi:hypothetical protein